VGVTENCLISSKMELIGLSRVCHENFTLKKSMIPTTLKHQNWVEPLSGSKSSNFKKKFKVNGYLSLDELLKKEKLDDQN